MTKLANNNSLRNKYEHMVVFLICFLVSFSSYSVYLTRHYSVDSYYAENYGVNLELVKSLGRFVDVFIYQVLNKFHINIVKEQQIFSFISIIMLSLVSYLIIIIFLRSRTDWNKKSFLILIISSLTMVNNTFISEWFIFPECTALFVLGLIFVVIAVYVITNNKITIKSFGVSFLLLLVGISSYQAVASFFVILGIVYFYHNSKDLKIVLKNTIILLSMYILCGGINIMYMKFTSITERTDFSRTDIIGNIKSILLIQPRLWLTNMSLMPRYIFIFSILILITIFIIISVKNNTSKKNGIDLVALFLIIFLTWGCAMAPHFLASTVWLAPRTIASFMIIPSIIGLFIAYSLNDKESGNKLYFNIISFILIVYLCFSFFGIQKIASGNIATNHIDEELAKSYYSKIVEYEKSTGIQVTKIAYRKDSLPTWAYSDIVSSFEINVRNMVVDYSVVPLFNHVSGRNFISAAMDESVYNQYFKDKNWDGFSLDQIVIQNDTAYLILY